MTRAPGLVQGFLFLALLGFLLGQALAKSAQHGRLLQRVPSVDQMLTKYWTNEEMEQYMSDFVRPERCGSIARKFSVGKSVQGRQLWVLELSNHAGVLEAKPNFKYVANMHGDEPSGRVLLLALAEWLCQQYARQKDPRAVRLLEGMHLFLMPTMNPDGFHIRRRTNAAGVDLNRDFPDPVKQGQENLRQPLGHEQPETLAAMSWALERSFVAGAQLHEGAVVANYPFDGYPDGSRQMRGRKQDTPDDATFQFLASTYARAHASMARSKEFKGGITNGAQWYPLYGGMQDWNYLAARCMDLTLEVSENKSIPEAQLRQLWLDNQDALLQLPLVAVLGGARGRVVEAGTNPPLPLAAEIKLLGQGRTVVASAVFGDYYRPLPPGLHTLSASMKGYHPSTAQVLISPNGSGMVLDFELRRLHLLGPQGPNERLQHDASAQQPAGAATPRAADASLAVAERTQRQQPGVVLQRLRTSKASYAAWIIGAHVGVVACFVALVGWEHSWGRQCWPRGAKGRSQTALRL